MSLNYNQAIKFFAPFVVTFFIFLIIGLPEYLYQEWFDPMYLIFYYMLIPKEKLISLGLCEKNFIYFLYFWELSILFIAIFYYHFYLKDLVIRTISLDPNMEPTLHDHTHQQQPSKTYNCRH